MAEQRTRSYDWMFEASMFVMELIFLILFCRLNPDFTDYTLFLGIAFTRHILVLLQNTQHYSCQILVMFFAAFHLGWAIRGMILVLSTFDSSAPICYYTLAFLAAGPGRIAVRLVGFIILFSFMFIFASILDCLGLISSVRRRQSMKHLAQMIRQHSTKMNPNQTYSHDGVCTICLDELTNGTDVTTTQCGHRFHIDCLSEWLSHHPTCPTCRQEVAANELALEPMPESNEAAEQV